MEEGKIEFYKNEKIFTIKINAIRYAKGVNKRDRQGRRSRIKPSGICFPAGYVAGILY
jgi:transcription initiation factor TFIID subunit TAF12